MAAKTRTRDVKAGEFDQVAIRLPVEFFGRIEAHLERMKAANPGADLCRADALRNLLALALLASEKAAS